MALNADDSMSSYRPFGHHWLDSAIQETLLPGSPWQQIYDKLSQVLAKRIQPELTDRDRRAAIFDMLGSEFLQKYLSKWTWDRPTKDLEKYSPEERKVILQTTQLLLKEKLDQAARDCGYLVSKGESGDRSSLSLSSPPPAPVEVPEEVIHTISKMDEIFKAGLHRYLVQEGMSASSGFNQSQPTNHQLTKLHEVRPSPNHGVSSSASSPSSNHGDGTNIPNCWGQTSDLLGRSLCAILRRDPGRLDEVCKRLMGRQLPGSLRHKVWNEMMLRNYKEANQGEKSSEWFLRKNFAKTVMRGKAELGITCTMTTNSPIDGLLKTAILEKYSNTPCLLKHQGQALLRQAQEALNILYVFDRSYQPYFIHWLYPIHLAVIEKTQGDADGPDDLPYELALELYLLRSHTFPRWSEILAVAQDVMLVVEREDPEFFSHLMRCSKTNVKIDPKDFLIHQIQEEQQKAASLTSHVSNDPDAMLGDDGQMLASPVMFIRKWLGEGFVGVCDTQAVLFMWDQCFMSNWSHEVLSRLCLSLLMLLRKNFLETAQDYHVMKQIFASEPCRLYTLDIQKAFQHLQNEGRVTDIPALNRRPVPKTEKKAPSPAVTFNPAHYALLTQSTPAELKNGSQAPILPGHKQAVAPPTASEHSPKSIAPSVAPKATPQVAPSVSKPRPESPASSAEEHRDLPSLSPSPASGDGSEDEEKGSGTSLPAERREHSPDRTLPVSLIDQEPEWVPFDLSAASDLPEAPPPKEGYDLYIDGIRFLPDNASIVKATVSGRYTSKQQGHPLNLSALPDLRSLARYPKFMYRARIEVGRADQIIELRVWTVDKFTHQLVVLGVCLLKVYNDRTKKLNIGSHQLRLRSGYPTPGQPILPQSVDHLASVPGCSILLRLLPHSEDFIEASPYASGMYQSDVCKPTDSETNVIEHYKRRTDWSERVKEMALELARSEDDNENDPETASTEEEKKMADTWSRMSDGALIKWMEERLQEKHRPRDSLPPLLELERCVEYEKDVGVVVKIRTAYGLQAENCYTIVLARLLLGPIASQMTMDAGDDGQSRRSESFLTNEMDMDSRMKSPRWKDKPRVLRPIYDEHSILLLQFFGLEVIYKIDPSGRTKGVVKARKGKGRLTLDNSSYLGWSVLPVFDRKCVIQGTFILPIFQNNKSKPFLKGLLDAPSLESWMRVSIERKEIQVHPSHPSAIVSIWDAHFYQGQTVPLPRREYFLHLAGDFSKFSLASQDKTGIPLNEIVLRSLPSSVRPEGTSGQKYLKEKQNFEEVMSNIATELMEDALLTTGQPPLTAGS